MTSTTSLAALSTSTATSYHQNRGRTVCANDLRARIDEADALVLAQVVERVLTLGTIERMIERALERLAERRQQGRTLPERLEAEIWRDCKQPDNVVAAIASGRAP